MKLEHMMSELAVAGNLDRRSMDQRPTLDFVEVVEAVAGAVVEYGKGPCFLVVVLLQIDH